MSSIIRHPKDFWSGIIFILAGAAAVYIAQEYSMGKAGRMGPAYFPTVLGGLLVVVGIIALVRSFMGAHQERITNFAVKPLILVLTAVALFAFLFREAGLLIAIPVLVLVGAFASDKFRFVPTLILGIGLALFSWILFVKLLGLPLPVLGPWLDF